MIYRLIQHGEVTFAPSATTEYWTTWPGDVYADRTECRPVLVSGIIGGRERKLTHGFLRVKSHYLFDAHFCRVDRANEKGVVLELDLSQLPSRRRLQGDSGDETD